MKWNKKTFNDGIHAFIGKNIQLEIIFKEKTKA